MRLSGPATRVVALCQNEHLTCAWGHVTGQWWLEYHRFLSLDDLAVLGQDAVDALRIPDDFSSSKELLKSLERHHCRWVLSATPAHALRQFV
jgi:hypothetical protein